MVWWVLQIIETQVTQLVRSVKGLTQLQDKFQGTLAGRRRDIFQAYSQVCDKTQFKIKTVVVDLQVQALRFHPCLIRAMMEIIKIVAQIWHKALMLRTKRRTKTK